MKEQRFRDRIEAGQLLAAKLAGYANRPDILVLGLPCGGVPVAFEVTRALHAPMDVMIVRKLGVPEEEELAMGAIASGDVCVLNDDIVRLLRIPEKLIHQVAAREQQELERRERLYWGGRPNSDVAGCTVILVDDGVATGATMEAAITAVKRQQPARLVIAVPVAAAATCAKFAEQVDELVCLLRPEDFVAIGFWSEHFSQTTDEEMRDLLQQARHQPLATPQGRQKTPEAEGQEKVPELCYPPSTRSTASANIWSARPAQSLLHRKAIQRR